MDPSGAAAFEIEPTQFSEALRRALDEDPGSGMLSDLRPHTDRLGKVSITGAVSSQQVGELELRRPLSKVLTRGFLSRAAGEYWRLITRFTLGLVRVASDGGDQCVVLLAAAGPAAPPSAGIRARGRQGVRHLANQARDPRRGRRARSRIPASLDRTGDLR